MEMKFVKCSVCGKIVAMVKETPVPTMCCGKPMQEIVPGTSDGAVEKHVPNFTVDGDRVYVTVGSQAHPMQPEHYIEWIAVQTKSGNQRKALTPGFEPKAVFALEDGDEVVSVYAYCNLHSLWKA